MTGFILRRLMQLLPVLVVASLGIWLMIYAVPGSPVGAIVGENATPEQIADTIKRLGLDQPMAVQYWTWLRNALQGDLGLSIQSREPVVDLIAHRIPATIQLGVAATVVGLLLGVPVAVLSALRPNSWLDRTLSGWSALALGVPTFWLGILLILLFAVTLRWLPSASAYVSIFESPWQALRNLALPALTLGVYVSGIFARFLRASLLGELRADYVRTARAKGLRERIVMRTHVLRNALLPVLTILGFAFATLLTGAVLTETIFEWNGIGSYAVAATRNLDYPAINGVCLFGGIVFLIANLVTDLLYAFADPKVRLS